MITNDPYNAAPNLLAQQHLFNTFHQRHIAPGNQRHPLAHQRSLPLPPPLLQQLQARQQQQHLQRNYYQSANKLLFDDHRYYAPNPPLHDQSFYAPAESSLLNEQPYYRNQYQQHYPRTRRPGYNLESTRGFNHSLQSQWLYGGAGRRSMAGDLLLSGHAPPLGDPLDPDQKIVNDFCLLYNESRQLFNGLRLVAGRSWLHSQGAHSLTPIAFPHAETCHKSAIKDGKLTSKQHSMPTLDFGAFSNSIVTF